jgi:outer membrane protein, multidrug efflux system
MRRSRCLATVLLVVGWLAGCMVGPDYKRPEVGVPADWRNGPDGRDSLGDLGWWELFKDPVLHELISTAVVANRDLQVAVARVLESRAQLGVTRAAQFPQVNAGGSYEYTRPFSKNAPMQQGGNNFTGDLWQADMDLTFELDLWGRLRRATEAARAELLASEETRRVVLMTLVADVARTHFDLLELDQELVIARRTLQTRQASLELERRRFERGLSAQLDVDRAEAEVAVAAATVPDLERLIAQTENGLSVLLGRNPGPIARGTPLDGQRLPPEVPAGLPSALLERRPDIRQAEQTLVAANARIGVAKAEYFPRISLTGLFGVESVSLSDLFTAGSRFWSIGPTMTVPLFTAGRIKNTVKATEARQQQAATQYLQAIEQAFREVEDALVFHRKLREIRTERERRVGASRRALSLVTLRYERGLSTQLEVLDAQRQLFSAELELTATTRDQLTAVVQLYKALGGGWQSQPQSAAGRPDHARSGTAVPSGRAGDNEG